MSDGPTDDVRKQIDESVKHAVERKVAEYKRLAQAFSLGLGALIGFLIAQNFISSESLLVFIHDQLFGFEASLDRAMAKNIAVSYNNQFVLGDHPDLETTQSIAFFAKSPQRVEAWVRLTHFGVGEQRNVTIWLDDARDDPILSNDRDLEFSPTELTNILDDRRHHLGRPTHVHFLNFDVAEDIETDDKVFVHVLINVLGRENEQD